MPKSKRNKVVHLTQVKKKGKDHKEDLLKQLEENVTKYEFVYVFDFDSTKSDRIMELRLKTKPHGRIFAGRNSLVSQALRTLGAKSETSYDSFLKHIKGHRGLLFTDVARDELISMLENGHEEFLDKLLGYAQLKTPDDDTVEGSAGDDDDDGGDDDGDDDDDATNKPTADGEVRKKCVSFKPIKRRKKKQKH